MVKQTGFLNLYAIYIISFATGGISAYFIKFKEIKLNNL